MTKSKTIKRANSDTAAAKDATASASTGKIGLLVELMRRPEGASLPAMQAATGWQPHSVRGAIAGSIKKKRGLGVTSEKTEAGRIYRIVEAQS